MQAFRKNLDRNSRIKDLQEKLLSGKLTGSEADLYAVEVGQALAKAFHDEINSDTLPDGKMYYNIASRVIPPLLRACYEDVADYAEAMYQGLNERAKLGIKAQRAKYSTDREKGLIEYACGSDDYSGRQKNFEGSLVNFSQSVATDTMKENAEFQYQAGLSPVIRRSANGGCCAWCAALAGVYPYEEVRATGSDVYRRHRDCRCTVTYDPGDGKVQNVHTKRWETLQEQRQKEIIEDRTKGIEKIKKDDIIRLRLNYFDRRDPLYIEAYSIEEIPGYEDVCGHGNPKRFECIINGRVRALTAEEFAEHIIENGDFHGQNLRFVSCAVAQGENSFAQQLSRILGVKVMGPDMDTYYNPEEGIVFIGSRYRNIGRWRVFKNGEEIE